MSTSASGSTAGIIVLNQAGTTLKEISLIKRNVIFSYYISSHKTTTQNFMIYPGTCTVQDFLSRSTCVKIVVSSSPPPKQQTRIL
jgi:hypothetical protein